ncbi:MAG: hypothetical protein IPL40_12890 [Proteobacteria bacterium]|nr:hypothetical protein [Pseudomonadota bacterium]
MTRLVMRLAAVAGMSLFLMACSTGLDTGSLNVGETDSGVTPDSAVSRDQGSGTVDTGVNPDSGTAPTPVIRLSVSPAGANATMNVTGGTSPGTAVTFTVRNLGNGAIAALTAPNLGAGTTNFRLVAGQNTCGTKVLAAGAECTFQVEPVANTNIPGGYTATLTIRDANDVRSNELTLEGTASGFPTNISVDPLSDTLAVTPTADPTFTFTFTNETGIPTNALKPAALSGTNSAKFSIVTDNCAGTALAASSPGNSCTVTVSTRNIAENGDHTAKLTVTDTTNDDITAVASLTADASGFDPVLVMTPDIPDPFLFTFTAGGAPPSSPETQVFTITNSGEGPTLALLAAGLSGTGAAAFTITADTCEDAVLEPTDTCTVTVAPDATALTADGTHDATLTVTDGVDSETRGLRVTASGFVATLALTAEVGAALDGMDVRYPGPLGTAITFTVTNTGFADTPVKPTPSLSSTDNFEIANNTCNAVLTTSGVDSNCTFQVRPTVTDNVTAYGANLDVNAGTGIEATPLALSGASRGWPVLLLTPTTPNSPLAISKTRPAAAPVFTVTYTANDGPASVMIAITLTNTTHFVLDDSISPCEGSTLVSGTTAYCGFKVGARNTAVADQTATLTITAPNTDDPPLGTITSNVADLIIAE